MSTSYKPVTSINELPSSAHTMLVDLWNELWSQIAVTDSPDDCWLWTGRVYKAKGSNLVPYGMFVYAGISEPAYRILWALTHPRQNSGNGLCIRHLCGNRLCCNPSHLTLGTAKENAQDRIAHGTQTRGSANRNSKLNEGIVYEILCGHANGVPPTVLSEKYGVYYGTIVKILDRTYWTHVPLPPNWSGYHTARQMKADRSRKGTLNTNAKFTEEQAYQLRVDFLNGAIPTHLARQHGVAPNNVIRILKGDGWRHVPFPPEWEGYDAISRRNYRADRARLQARRSAK